MFLVIMKGRRGLVRIFNFRIYIDLFFVLDDFKRLKIRKI